MTTSRSIDLNADIGEHDGDRYASDFALLEVVSSANIACGAHAGSTEVMRATIAAAYERGVSIGAHPSYPDREGFGRRDLGLANDAIVRSFEAQVELLAEACAVEGAVLAYVKPHGALYNRAAKDAELAHLLAACAFRFDSWLTMLALAGSALEHESKAVGLRVAREAFIDRAYLADGTLVPRDQMGAVLHDSEAAATRAVLMARDHEVTAIDGTIIRVDADSLCVHGDSSNALETILLARGALEGAGFSIRSFAP
ncbi:MAG TPA: 5-oxoprolinase subunit PxpA [Gemmatimonadaceae bacterium]|nr:5-oxoprolinase subunit PxpA [Gemmatimonadaceae bacterium]